eukprot:1897081-Rhodomonas_salina.1
MSFKRRKIKLLFVFLRGGYYYSCYNNNNSENSHPLPMYPSGAKTTRFRRLRDVRFVQPRSLLWRPWTELGKEVLFPFRAV